MNTQDYINYINEMYAQNLELFLNGEITREQYELRRDANNDIWKKQINKQIK